MEKRWKSRFIMCCVTWNMTCGVIYVYYDLHALLYVTKIIMCNFNIVQCLATGSKASDFSKIIDVRERKHWTIEGVRRLCWVTPLIQYFESSSHGSWEQHNLLLFIRKWHIANKYKHLLHVCVINFTTSNIHISINWIVQYVQVLRCQFHSLSPRRHQRQLPLWITLS